MTTIDAAAAENVQRSIIYPAIAALVALSVSACSSGNGGGLLDGLGQQSAANTSTAQAPAAPIKGSVNIAPLIGPPDAVSRQLTATLGSQLASNGVQVVPTAAGAVKSDYTIRGYVVAAREAAGTKVSYIWDLTNPSGVRVHRITGEEVVRGAAGTSPWATVTPQVMTSIANRTAVAIAGWMPNRPGVMPETGAPAAVAGRSTQSQRTAASSPALATPPLAGARTKTGSIPTAAPTLAVAVPRVAGAPGDGPTALARALQNELRKSGIALASGRTVAGAHRVEGKVLVGAAKAGKQPISIDWVVKDPSGVKLGTVSQNNEIPAGSLNGEWGPTAGAAAAAAAQGIVRLLPKNAAKRS